MFVLLALNKVISQKFQVVNYELANIVLVVAVIGIVVFADAEHWPLSLAVLQATTSHGKAVFWQDSQQPTARRTEKGYGKEITKIFHKTNCGFNP